MDDLSRRRPLVVLLGLAVYFVATGGLLAVLSMVNEPVAGKIYPRGVEFGLELVALAWPLTLLTPLPRVRASTSEILDVLYRRVFNGGTAPPPVYVTGACIHWIYTFVVAVIFLFPRQLLHPLLEVLKLLPQGPVSAAFALLTLLAIQLLIGAVVLGVLRTVGLALVLGPYLRQWRVLAHAIASGVVPAVPVAWLMLDSGPAAWLRPPATLEPDVLGAFVLGGIAVMVIAQAPSPRIATTDVPEPEPVGRMTSTLLRLALLALVGLGWIGVADRWAAGGILAPRVAFDGPVPVHIGLTIVELEATVRRITVRTGFDAVGETFRIRFAEHGEVNVRSDRRSLPSGTQIIIDGSRPAQEVRDLLAFQLASTLAELRFWPLQRYHRAGFAFWASEASGDPFRDGYVGRWPATLACDDVPFLDLFARLNEDVLAPSGLPFLLAEREGGPRKAQDLLRTMLLGSSDPEDWRSEMVAACGRLTTPPRRPLPLEIEVVRTPNGPAPDGLYERRLLDEMKKRGALSEGDHRFVIRYAELPPGRSSASTFTDVRTIVVTVNALLGPAEREASLRRHFVGDLVTARYGNDAEPLRSGYAIWAARDATDPFITGRPSPGGSTMASLCRQAATTDLRASTLGSVWLSSAPFADAERAGGEAAAQQLLREGLRANATYEEWRSRILEVCARVT